MEKTLENLSKEDLLKVISSRDEKIDYLESQLAMYKRMQFGQKRERFEGDPDQIMLPFNAESVVCYFGQLNDCLNSNGVWFVLFLNTLLNDCGYSKPN